MLEEEVNDLIKEIHNKDYYILWDYKLEIIEYGEYMSDINGDYIDTVGVYTFGEIKQILREKKIEKVLEN